MKQIKKSPELEITQEISPEIEGDKKTKNNKILILILCAAGFISAILGLRLMYLSNQPKDVLPEKGRCGDGVCDKIEKKRINFCPEDCDNSTNIVKSCDNFPPPNFCSGGIDNVIVTGVDEDECSVYGCKVGEITKSLDSSSRRFGFLSAMGQGAKIQSDVWSSSFNLNMQEESQKLAKELGIGWSREVSFMYVGAGRDNSSLSPHASEKLKLAKELNLEIVSTILIEEDVFKSDQEGYKTWLASVVSAYKDDIKYWQIQNEVGKTGRYDNSSNDYLDLVKISSPIIKDNCSDCKVLMASIYPNEEYYKAVVNSGDSYVDAYDFHIFEEDELEMFNIFINFLSEKNILKPVFITEMATHSGAPIGQREFQSEQIQAETLIKWHAEAFAIGADYVFWNELVEWYKFKNFTDGLFDFTGLVYNGLCTSPDTNDVCNDTSVDKGTLVKKEAYHSLKALIEKIDGFDSVEKINENQYKFSDENKNVYILWCDSGSCATPSEINGSVKIIDYLGTESTIDAKDLVLTSSPVFIEEK